MITTSRIISIASINCLKYWLQSASASISINRINRLKDWLQSASISISINQHQLASISINRLKDWLFPVYCSAPPLVQHASHNGPTGAISSSSSLSSSSSYHHYRRHHHRHCHHHHVHDQNFVLQMRSNSNWRLFWSTAVFPVTLHLHLIVTSFSL